MPRSQKSSSGGEEYDSRRQRQRDRDYYIRELPIWRSFRLFGLACSSVGLVLNVVSLFSADWLRRTSDWQNAVIGLLVFSLVFGFVATVLTICGMLTTALPKKIYYFHSAGEIYFVCAVSTMIALAVYPAAIETERQLSGHTYGAGFGVGWGAVFFFLLSALCMCLDDLVKSCAKCCCPPPDMDRDSNL